MTGKFATCKHLCILSSPDLPRGTAYFKKEAMKESGRGTGQIDARLIGKIAFKSIIYRLLNKVGDLPELYPGLELLYCSSVIIFLHILYLLSIPLLLPLLLILLLPG